MSITNSNIIEIFKQLKKKVKNDIDDKNVTYKLRVIDNTIDAINNFNKNITLQNFTELGNIKGIGKKTIAKIEEILKTGELQTLKDFAETDNNIEKTKLLEELKTIVGVGDAIAERFIKKGIISVDDLKKKVFNKEIKVNDKIVLGIKYHNKFFDNIPKKEIDQVQIKFNNIINTLNVNNTKDNKFILEICGSYRRNKAKSGDIDILISKLNNENIGSYLRIFVDNLKENNLLVDDITNKNYKTKYMGFLKYKNNPIRRIDIRFVPWSSFYYSLLYFTGSMEFNREIRQIAKEKGYRLSEYALYDIDTNNKVDIDITSEKDIFDFLKIKYIEPNNR